ncbi:MAG TPA: DUF5989 family protein [Elusimicrobiales bacterium]|nr:DUF5989 family protein [Elusimicrobiales bacterium]
MKKIAYLMKEAFYLVKKHKMYFLLPILLVLAVLAVLAYHLGPGLATVFIYAGV